MTWTRLSDNYDGSTVNLSDAAFRTDVQALIWCNRNLTDGALPRRAVRLVSTDDSALSELVDSGRWTVTEDGYQLDWSDQELAEAVKKRRERNADAQRTFRERRDLHVSGDHSKCDPARCDALRGRSRNALHNSSVTDTRPVPSPSRGQGKRGTPKGTRSPKDCTTLGHSFSSLSGWCDRGCGTRDDDPAGAVHDSDAKGTE